MSCCSCGEQAAHKQLCSKKPHTEVSFPETLAPLCVSFLENSVAGQSSTSCLSIGDLPCGAAWVALPRLQCAVAGPPLELCRFPALTQPPTDSSITPLQLHPKLHGRAIHVFKALLPGVVTFSIISSSVFLLVSAKHSFERA